MTSLDSSRPVRRAALDFAEARLAAEQAETVQQHAAARRVAERAHDAVDCRELLAMLGLSGRLTQGAHE
ncbi:hypothetical protein UK23_44665 [Lentzea aerocolonigenes]|uniref:Uncharacterized protein n=2 Tax=Lentzea aerocolonigenes TaxID=68170 RepID=A0A0F0GER5_LENAE|nr:hypothetical protein UK23_44665 [Lentzea aerocolonigenes]